MKSLHAIKQRLAQYQSASLQRQRFEIDASQNEWVNFASNDYLGLSAHPLVKQAICDATLQYGAGSRASPLVTGFSSIVKQTETAFAQYFGYSRALMFVSGYQANLGVLSALADKHSLLFHDKHNHASLIDGVKLSDAKHHRYAHNDLQHLSQLLAKHDADCRIICSDSVFSMQGDVADLAALSSIAKQAQAMSVIDEAHAVGVIGEGGRGAIAAAGLNANDIDVMVLPLGKTFGVSGAMVLASDEVIEAITQFARSYIYSTGVSPIIAAAAKQSLQVFAQESWRVEKLKELLMFCQHKVDSWQLPLVINQSAIINWKIGCEQRAMQYQQLLMQHGFYAHAMRYPSVAKGDAMIRIVITADHDQLQIENLLKAIKTINETSTQ